jgi:hypothetical protein
LKLVAMRQYTWLGHGVGSALSFVMTRVSSWLGPVQCPARLRCARNEP